jgi:hypothetical protein
LTYPCAETIALFVNMDKDVVSTSAVQHIRGTVSSYPFSPFVPVNNRSVPVNKIDAHFDINQKLFIKFPA